MALGAAIAVVSIPATAVLPGPRISTIPITNPTAITPVGSISGQRRLLIERQVNDKPLVVQVPLSGCPESFGLPFLACSACGGESPTDSGLCLMGNLDSAFFLCKCKFAFAPRLQISFIALTRHR